jgi:uncharacterized protein (TIGR03435 family)
VQATTTVLGPRIQHVRKREAVKRVAWVTLTLLAGLAATNTMATAQSAGDATIDVAVVRPHPSAVMHNNFSFTRNRFILEDQPLLKLIAFAYGLNPHQVVNAPSWVAENHWDMSGTTNLTEDATFVQEQQLIRQLLAERFGLRFHHEKREMSAYALRIFKNPPKLATAADASAQPLEWTAGHGWTRTEHFRSSTMTYFLGMQQLFMDRPLTDETGLTGQYDFELSYSYGDAPATDSDAPPLFTAMKEQLGLKFEPVKTAVDVMVIDNINMPTEN